MRSVSESEHQKHLRLLDVYGYTRIESALSAEEASDLKDIVLSHFDQQMQSQFEGLPSRDSRDLKVFNLQNKDKRFVDLLCAPELQRILIEKLNDPYYRYLPPEQPNYILSYFNARSSGRQLELHNDSYIPATGDQTWMMQVVFVLDGFTKENGQTIVVPGSHKSGKYANRELAESEVTGIEANPGDIVLWDSRTWHGTTENVSPTPRWAIVGTLSMWWIKQSMDMTRGLPEEMYAQLTDEQKRLLGFCSIPPANENQRINTKTGFESLKSTVSEYYSTQ